MRRLAAHIAGLLCLGLALAGQDDGPGVAPLPPMPAAPQSPEEVAPAAPAGGAPAWPAPAPGGMRGFGADPGAMFLLASQMDADRNYLVDDKELAAGLHQFAQDAGAVRTNLLAWLDENHDGVLGPDEWRPFFTAMWTLSLIRSVDQSGDLVLQPAEVDAARARMAEFSRHGNERTLQLYDRNHDGELSKDEVQAARQAMRRFNLRGRGANPSAPGSGPGHGTGPSGGPAVGPPTEVPGASP